MGDARVLVARPSVRRDLQSDTERPADRTPIPVQRKLTVGPSDDPYETEADRIADQVMRTLENGHDVAAHHEVATPVATRISRRATVGSDGGDVDQDTERSIDRARSGGKPLDGPVRRSMEGAFGTDFSGIRVHVDARSDDLNDRIQARAFTTGSDVFVRRQDYAPTTPTGQRLLAHELAHTVQQGATARRSTRSSASIQRLSVDRPLKKITSIEVFSEGASGKAAKVSDGGKSVVVKVDQSNAVEVIAADRLARKGGAAAGKFKVKAPHSRIATPQDVAELKVKANTPNVMVNADPRSFLTGLDGNHPTLIAEDMGGDSLQKQLKAAAGRTETDEINPKTKKKNIVYRPDQALIESIKGLLAPAPIRTMAMAQASDVAMGMADRVLGGWNAENFLFDAKKKRFAFVDNTQHTGPGFLVTNSIQNAEASFNEWCNHYMTKQLVGDIDRLAVNFVSKFTGLNMEGSEFSDGGLLYVFTGLGAKYNESETRTAHDEILELMKANWGTMVAAAKAGLTAGKNTVIKNLSGIDKLTAGVPGAGRLEAATSLAARAYVLKGGSPAAAWLASGPVARKALGLAAMPALPALPQPPVDPNNPNGAPNQGPGKPAKKGFFGTSKSTKK